MMNYTLNNKTIFMVVLFLTIFFQEVQANPESPEYLRTKDWKIEKLETGNLVFTAKAVFYNPNKVKAKLRHVDLDVFVNDKIIGKVLQTDIIKINGESSFDIPLRMEFNLKDTELDLLESVFTLLSNNKFIVDMKGFIKMNVFLIPFKLPINERQEFSASDFL